MEKFPGHIACDAESASEIVVPIMQGGKVSFLVPFRHLFSFDFLSVIEKKREKSAELV